MTINYTGTNGGGSFPNVIPGPANTEDVDGASVGLVAQGAANLTKRLYDNMTRVAYTDGVRGFNGRQAVGSVRTVVGDPGVLKTIGLPGSGADFQGTRFSFDGTPSTNRVVRIDDSGVTPVEGETMQLFIDVMSSGLTYEFQRPDSTPICEVWGLDDGDAGAWVEFEHISGAWKLGRNSGASYSATYTGTSSVGVVPKAGAY